MFSAALDAEFNAQGRIKVLGVILYLQALNDLCSVRGGAASSLQGCGSNSTVLPVRLIQFSAMDFASLVSGHKDQLRSACRAEVVNNVCKQHMGLICAVEQEASLLSLLK